MNRFCYQIVIPVKTGLLMFENGISGSPAESSGDDRLVSYCKATHLASRQATGLCPRRHPGWGSGKNIIMNPR